MSIRIEGLSDLIKTLKQYQNTLDEREQKCLKLLADIGIDTAKVRFSQAQYDGRNDVEVTGPKWIDKNKIAVYAEGESVTFIEFGAGVVFSKKHPLADELGFERGLYGIGKGNQTTWGYYGEKGTDGKFLRTTDKGDLYLTHGNPANRPMYDAGKAIQEQILSVVKQVFRFD